MNNSNKNNQQANIDIYNKSLDVQNKQYEAIIKIAENMGKMGETQIKLAEIDDKQDDRSFKLKRILIIFGSIIVIGLLAFAVYLIINNNPDNRGIGTTILTGVIAFISGAITGGAVIKVSIKTNTPSNNQIFR